MFDAIFPIQTDLLKSYESCQGDEKQDFETVDGSPLWVYSWKDYNVNLVFSWLHNNISDFFILTEQFPENEQSSSPQPHACGKSG